MWVGVFLVSFVQNVDSSSLPRVGDLAHIVANL
jgi:hypothetical protein